MSKNDDDPDRKTLAKFVEDHFTLENQLEEFEPQDWIDEPSILEVISGKWQGDQSPISYKYKLNLGSSLAWYGSGWRQ